jgi:hypothetical protein
MSHPENLRQFKISSYIRKHENLAHTFGPYLRENAINGDDFWDDPDIRINRQRFLEQLLQR